jgi:hypothetical protein
MNIRKGLPQPARRWAVSFADLTLLIACVLMLGWRPAGGEAAEADVPAPLAAVSVTMMFVPGEAMLSARGALLLAPARRIMANGGQIRVAVGAALPGSARLDAWELAAARTAVLARTLGADRVVLDAPTADDLVRITPVR